MRCLVLILVPLVSGTMEGIDVGFTSVKSCAAGNEAAQLRLLDNLVATRDNTGLTCFALLQFCPGAISRSIRQRATGGSTNMFALSEGDTYRCQ